MPSLLFAKTTLRVIAILLTCLVLHACTTTKDGFAYRAYHNTTAHFNGHFNAGESMKKGVEKIQAAHEEDYDEILPVFIYGTEATSKEAYPEMERVITKCEKVISKHTMTSETKKGKKRPKFNKWIDENYLLIGLAHFYKRSYYKAEEVFQYVGRKYKEKEPQVISAAWLARSYMEREEYGRAAQALNRVSPEGDIPDRVKADYYLVYADLFLRQEKLESAAEKMELALKHIKRKRQRARYLFILAQIYQRLNKANEAQRGYDAVIHSRPPYELEFYARINKALSFSRRGGSSEEIRRELLKLLRDEKNKDYRDQIYYALGDLALEDQNRNEAIGYFEESILAAAPKSKSKVKAFLRLADLYFDQRKYGYAQVNYDSTLMRIDEKHTRYKEIKARAESLTELVGYLDTVYLNDSLLTLCGMSEDQREKAIRKAQKQLELEAEKKRRDDEERAAKAAKEAATAGGLSGTFWAYNENLRKKGYEYFQDYWGGRPLKDNWRLQSKLSLDFGSTDEGVAADQASENQAENLANSDKYYVPTLDELRAQLPCEDDGKMKTAEAEIAEAYYMAGVIYKEKLNDEDNAIDSWEQLIRNVDDSDYHPVAHYLLFRTWWSKEQLSNYKKNPFCETCDSQYWGDLIKRLYPGSDWAKLVDNPEYLDIKDVKESEEREAYTLVYRMYTDRNFPAAASACSRVINNEPDNHLICKYRLLRAVCVGYTDAAFGIKEKYLEELRSVVSSCPGTAEAERSQELLKAAKDEGVAQMNEPVKQDESSGKENPPPVIQEDVFTMNENVEHYFVLVAPTQGVNINTIKAKIADYNTEYFASANLKVTNNLLDRETHMVLVKPFRTIPEARDYNVAFESNSSRLGEINDAGYATFLISKPNYIQLFKTKDLDGYIQFYQQNY